MARKSRIAANMTGERERPRAITEDDEILEEARDRFKRAEDWESDFRILYVNDVKFANADSDNGWQWPDDLRQNRLKNKRPALTINKTAQHVLLVTNDGRQNKPGVKIRPVGEKVSYKAAEIWEGIVRHIEYKSAAQTVYDDAMESQVEGGIGWWRVGTDYIDEDTFDQEILVQPVRDHLGVYLDCDIKQKDGSDAIWGFVFEEVSNEVFKRAYPKVDIPGASSALNEESFGNWIRDDGVRVAEYYRIKETSDELIYFEVDGKDVSFKKSEASPEIMEQVEKAEEDPKNSVRRRPVKTRQLEWFKIAGNQIIDRRKLKGRYIPLVRLVGREKTIEGKLVRSGLVRTLKDAQRMYNYNTSSEVEHGALQSKTPWVGPAAAFEGNNVAWANANRDNAAFLTYKHLDANGDPLPAPIRPEAPAVAPVYLEGLKIAAQEMAMASGQYDAQFGKPSNEKSGVAIAERQRQGDTATYHFIDNLGIAIRYTGIIILDLAPHIYDTERVLKIMGKDYSFAEVTIDPGADQAYLQKEKNDDENEAKIIFNPKKGKYIVEADMGPAFSTQRQEAWNAFVQIVTQSPELINEIGDIMFLAADFPNADKIAERLYRKIKAQTPYLLDDAAPSPQVAQLSQELDGASKTIAALLEKAALDKISLKGKDEKRDIDAFKAQSDRIGVVANAVPELGLEHVMPLIQKSIHEALMQHLEPIFAANADVIDGSDEQQAQ